MANFEQKRLGPWLARVFEDFTEIEIPSSKPYADPYSVIVETDGSMACQCKGFEYRHTCRHVNEVKAYIKEHSK